MERDIMIPILCLRQITKVTSTGFFVKNIFISEMDFFAFSKRTIIEPCFPPKYILSQSDSEYHLGVLGKDKFLRIYGLLETIYHTYSFTENLSQ